MSVPFVPGLESGTSLEGNIEISSADLKVVTFTPNEAFSQDDIRRLSISDYADEAFLLHGVLSGSECGCLIEQGEDQEFDTIRGVRDDYRSCKRYSFQGFKVFIH